MSNEIILDHRETHLNMMAHDHRTWELFTDDPYWIRRMEKLGIEPTEKVGDGFLYRLLADQVLIRKGKRQVSDKQRQIAAERMKLLRDRQATAKSMSDSESKR